MTTTDDASGHEGRQRLLPVIIWLETCLLAAEETVGTSRPRSDDDADNNDEDDGVDDLLTFVVWVAAGRESDTVNASSPRYSPATLTAGLLGSPTAPSPGRDATVGRRAAGRSGGSLSKGRGTEKIVDDEVEVLTGDVVELTSARVRATAVATALDVAGEGDVTPPFYNNRIQATAETDFQQVWESD